MFAQIQGCSGFRRVALVSYAAVSSILLFVCCCWVAMSCAGIGGKLGLFHDSSSTPFSINHMCPTLPYNILLKDFSTTLFSNTCNTLLQHFSTITPFANPSIQLFFSTIQHPSPTLLNSLRHFFSTLFSPTSLQHSEKKNDGFIAPAAQKLLPTSIYIYANTGCVASLRKTLTLSQNEYGYKS